MTPKVAVDMGQQGLFRSRLDQIIIMRHDPAVVPAHIDRDKLADACGLTCSNGPVNQLRRPGRRREVTFSILPSICQTSRRTQSMCGICIFGIVAARSFLAGLLLWIIFFPASVASEHGREELDGAAAV